MNKKIFFRTFFYLLGLFILAIGIVLNTKVDLGVSPIVSVSYNIHKISGINFANTTLIWYAIFVLIEVIIHLYLKSYKMIIFDCIQIAVSILFTRFLNLFDMLIPVMSKTDGFLSSVACRLFILAIAIILTGIGAAVSLNMKIVPNPGDGIVQALSDLTRRSVGLMKNCLDISCVIISCLLGVGILHKLEGIGIGTILAMLGVGRVVAVFNRTCKEKMDIISGIQT